MVRGGGSGRGWVDGCEPRIEVVNMQSVGGGSRLCGCEPTVIEVIVKMHKKGGGWGRSPVGGPVGGGAVGWVAGCVTKDNEAIVKMQKKICGDPVRWRGG